MEDIEYGWLLDKVDQQRCFGVVDGQPSWVPYTHVDAIRFARQQDASKFLAGLIIISQGEAFYDVSAVRHSWG